LGQTAPLSCDEEKKEQHVHIDPSLVLQSKAGRRHAVEAIEAQ